VVSPVGYGLEIKGGQWAVRIAEILPRLVPGVSLSKKHNPGSEMKHCLGKDDRAKVR